MSKKRVVITGLGIISPIGNDVPTAWENALAGKSGIKNITDFDTTHFTTKFAGTVEDFDPTKYMSAKDVKKCDPFIQYGIAAAKQALDESLLLDMPTLDKNRVGIIMGSGIGGIGSIESSTQTLLESGPKKISPFFIPSSIINMIAGHISIMYGFKGPNLAIATACTTGTHSIGLAARTIAYGDADVMIAGGAEKASTPLGLAGFSAARALSTRNDEPQRASRPWDVERDGFVMGDGAGAVVLEEYEHAKARGANIYCEIIGFGMSGDAYHMTRPSGDGATQAIKNAILDAGIDPKLIGYINAHGTSTPAGDIEELKSIKAALGEENAKNALVSSTKSMTGHLLGAAGAIEAIFSILALKNNIVPPTINLDNPDPECDLDCVANTAREKQLTCVLSNSFGFGGTNGSIIFRAID